MRQVVSRMSLALAYALAPAMSIAADASTGKSACDLLSDAEIKAVQGEDVSARRPSASRDSGLSVSQCYFALPTPSKSISLSLTSRGDGTVAKNPRNLWYDRFDNAKQQKSDADKKSAGVAHESEAEEAHAHPDRVRGLGDAAYWLPSPVGGVLYVLEGNRYFTISVGGPDSVAKKLDKSKALARRVVMHLH